MLPFFRDTLYVLSIPIKLVEKRLLQTSIASRIASLLSFKWILCRLFTSKILTMQAELEQGQPAWLDAFGAKKIDHIRFS